MWYDAGAHGTFAQGIPVVKTIVNDMGDHI